MGFPFHPYSASVSVGIRMALQLMAKSLNRYWHCSPDRKKQLNRISNMLTVSSMKLRAPAECWLLSGHHIWNPEHSGLKELLTWQLTGAKPFASKGPL